MTTTTNPRPVSAPARGAAAGRPIPVSKPVRTEDRRRAEQAAVRREAARQQAIRFCRLARADLDGPASDVADALYDWALENEGQLPWCADPGVWAEDTALVALG